MSRPSVWVVGRPSSTTAAVRIGREDDRDRVRRVQVLDYAAWCRRVTAVRTDGRRLIESEVAIRAAHRREEDVRRTASLATAERLFGHEYHGRFLIELLQNAADAWGDRIKDERRSRLEVAIAEGPALVVANQGDPFPAKTVIESLGHIGRSTKVEGQAIGHKGIGFKSVLELSSTPEIYSGLSSDDPGLAVRFDPRAALKTIRNASPEWDRLAADHVREFKGNELAIVPVLQFPLWVESLPPAIEELARRGFETVVRVPFRDDLRPEPELDEEKWLAGVRDAIDRVTDEMLLLLGAFDEVILQDQLERKTTTIRPDWDRPREVPDSTRREHVVVSRDGVLSSRWLLFRRSLPDRHDLAGEILAGMRLEGEESSVAAPVANEPSAPFYLFFPTKIRSGLPLLLHGYFEVNAARTGFYDGAAARNGAILRELAKLVRTAVADVASKSDVGIASFVELVGEAQAQPPDENLARSFCDGVLELLDDVAWVPLEAEPSGPAYGKPTELLVDEDSRVVEKLRDTFPPAYVREKTDLEVPSRLIGEAGHRFLVSRRREGAQTLWDIVGVLCRPGPEGPWPAGDEQAGFLALIELFAALAVNDRSRAEALLEELRGDESSVLVPVSAGDHRIAMLPLPDPSEGVAGRRSRGIMARTGARGAASLVPPPSLDLAFVPDGLLSNEGRVDQAKLLGIRPFTVANVLGRMVEARDHEDEPGELASFLWRLLSRDTTSEFSVQNAWERAREFSPAEWFWCQASPAVGGPDRERQRWRQRLAGVRLPARDGSWRPAGTLAFGSDWAEWVAARHPASAAREDRREAYAALEEVSPGDAAMLASPDTVGGVLGPPPRAAEERSDADPDTWLHAFLLELGVWETLPVEGFDDAGVIGRARFPWEEDPFDRLREQLIKPEGRWTFGLEGWGGDQHTSAWVAQDFRFRWSLTDSARRNAGAVSRLLGAASTLYERSLRLTVFCPNCSQGWNRHTVRRWSSPADAYPSLLALELQKGEWVAALRDGRHLSAPLAPTDVWWAPSVPSGAALAQSPLRFLALSDPSAGVNSRLRELAGLHSLADADRKSILRLLQRLRDDFDRAALEPDPRSSSSARRAFVALHRQAYERLAELPALDGEQNDDADALGVLCDVGDALEYRPPATVFHDDGAFASYRRYFSGRIPFSELAKEKGSVAAHLGVRRFEVELRRRDSDAPQDVTEEVNDLLRDRVPEFLAILVHHVLAGQTLEPTGSEFEARARRLMRLKVYRVRDLVIEARVIGTDVSATIGEGSDQELFLDGATTPDPVIYHDLSGDSWQERFRRKLAPYVARILERPDYADIFALFLLDETDAEREATLLERGITSADVDAIRAAIGVVSEREKRLHRRWFGAIAAVLTGSDAPADLAEDAAAERLTAAGLSRDDAARIIDYGGGEQARQDVGHGGALEFLRDHGVDLRSLDKVLRVAGDDGLRVGVARARLREWSAHNGRAVAAVLARRLDAEVAKSTVLGWRSPDDLEYELDPPAAKWLAPVLESLTAAALDPRPADLAERPTDELLRISGVESHEQLEALTRTLYDAEERRRILTAAAAAWRSELRLLGILSRTSPTEGRAATRLQAEAVDAILPFNPSSPTELKPSLTDLLPGHESLQLTLSERLTDSVSARGADRNELLALADVHGLTTAHVSAVLQALQVPRRELARQMRESIGAMNDRGLRVAVPAGLGRLPRSPKGPSKRRTIPAIKVTPSSDKRKRQLGEQGERWALAAMIRELTEMPTAQRSAAIDEMLKLVEGFEGTPIEAARAHAEAARAHDLEEDELIDELAGFLHVADYSDAFGFDMLGWIKPADADKARAMLVEVKSSADGTFHLSPSEWKRAEQFEDEYSVLVVRRAASGGVPQRLDLLSDPVALVSENRLDKTPDGWIIGYTSRS